MMQDDLDVILLSVAELKISRAFKANFRDFVKTVPRSSLMTYCIYPLQRSRSDEFRVIIGSSKGNLSGADPGGGGGRGPPPPALDHQFSFSTNFLTSKKKKSKTIARNILWTLCTLI